MFIRFTKVALLGLVLVTAAGCGARSPTQSNPQLGESGASCGALGALCDDTCVCDSPTTCVGGVCAAGASCLTNMDCTGNAYCHYPSVYDATVPGWVNGTAGTCDAPCTSCPLSNGFFQTCNASNGFCYTEIDCDPTNPNTKCPPREVCNAQTHTCSAPPDTCYFNDQCPPGWVCNTENNCVDPDIILGGCTFNTDCDAVAGCSPGSCECNANGQCIAISGCPGTPCPTGSYCAAGTCQTAPACPNGQNDCTPYGLVCVAGSCTNPDACVNGTCQTNYECNTVSNECFPIGTNECLRDEDCPAGKYCELFNGTCQIGCRNDLECEGQCPLGTGCSCDSTHTCVDDTINTGDSCNGTNCPSGSACAPIDPSDFTCLLSNAFDFDVAPIPGICPKECKIVCDILLEPIQPKCPSGTSCEPEGGFIGILFALLGGTGGTTSTVGFCY